VAIQERGPLGKEVDKEQSDFGRYNNVAHAPGAGANGRRASCDRGRCNPAHVFLRLL
jgi:hypothetical protein